VIFAPIVYDDHIDGALLTFHRIKREFSGSRKTGERLPVDFIPVTQFDDISQRSGAMKECINSAKLFAMSDRPVVLAGETGTERRMIAESIHNFGEHSKGAFVEVSCAGLSSEQQKELIFSEKGALHKAQEGTLFITDLEMMTDDNQHRLYRTLRYNLIPDEDGKNTYSNVRVITTAPRPLIELYNDGIIRRELYYILSGLELIVPPLCKRPEDLSYHLDAVLRRLYARYGRFHVLSAAAREYLFSYEWPGNLLQLESFCERLVITAGKRSISEAAVRQLMEEMYGELPVRFSQSADASACETQQVGISNTAQNIVQTGDNGTPFSQLGMPPAASCIIKALEDNAGNRPKAAAQLGISTTTLWRRMNKYGIEW
jgi:DNA-binding NtrC family response regulator